MNDQTNTFELKITPDVTELDSNPLLKELISNWLFEHGIQGVVEGCVDDLYMDPDYEDGTTHGPIIDSLIREQPLSIFKYERTELEDIESQLFKKFGNKISTTITSTSTESWKEGWKESFKLIETSRFKIFPPWERPEVSDEKFMLEIEPGMAFGTGQHATTMLCIEALEAIYRNQVPESALDFGCGSGILALAMNMLGTKNVLGIDIDSDAVSASKDNLVRNNLNRSEFDFVTSGDINRSTQYPLVVANILANILITRLDSIEASLRHGGVFLASGILAEQSEEFITEAQKRKLLLLEVKEKSDWVAITFKRGND